MSFSEFVHEQYRDLPIIPESCENQIVIVTGANSGLGFEAAKHFVYLNASRVILAVRSKAKGEAAKALIERPTRGGRSMGT
jgi:retinol dehydrogenase-12